MLHLDILAPALGISIFLLIYYTAVGFFTVYLTSNFGFTTSKANGINTWYWGDQRDQPGGRRASCRTACGCASRSWWPAPCWRS